MQQIPKQAIPFCLYAIGALSNGVKYLAANVDNSEEELWILRYLRPFWALVIASLEGSDNAVCQSVKCV